jgi:hypothetical protein
MPLSPAEMPKWKRWALTGTMGGVALLGAGCGVEQHAAAQSPAVTNSQETPPKVNAPAEKLQNQPASPATTENTKETAPAKPTPATTHEQPSPEKTTPVNLGGEIQPDQFSKLLFGQPGHVVLIDAEDINASSLPSNVAAYFEGREEPGNEPNDKVVGKVTATGQSAAESLQTVESENPNSQEVKLDGQHEAAWIPSQDQMVVPLDNFTLPHQAPIPYAEMTITYETYVDGETESPDSLLPYVQNFSKDVIQDFYANDNLN